MRAIRRTNRACPLCNDRRLSDAGLDPELENSVTIRQGMWVNAMVTATVVDTQVFASLVAPHSNTPQSQVASEDCHLQGQDHLESDSPATALT